MIKIYTSPSCSSCKKAKDFFKSLTIEETMKMIDIIMSAQKDYKNVGSIIPLFEVTILKLVTTKKDGAPKEEYDEPLPKIEKPLPKPEPTVFKTPEAPKPEPKVEEPVSLFDHPVEEV